jgi:hypothetical protein
MAAVHILPIGRYHNIVSLESDNLCANYGSLHIILGRLLIFLMQTAVSYCKDEMRSRRSAFSSVHGTLGGLSAQQLHKSLTVGSVSLPLPK